MRYVITINQLALSEMGSKISVEEAILLDYLYWLCSSPSEEVAQMRIERDGRRYTWFDYGHYIKETPILRGKTRATITPKLKHLEKEGFIQTMMKTGNDGGERKFIALLPKADGLFRKLNEPIRKSQGDPFRKLNIDNIDNNNKEKENITKEKENTLIVYHHFLDKFGKNEGTCKLTNLRKVKIKERLTEFPLQDILKAISNASEDSFYSGQNGRGWVASLEYITRNAEIIERLRDMTPRKGGINNGGFIHPNRPRPGKYEGVSE